VTQFSLLAVLEGVQKDEGIAMTRLAEILGTDRTTLTRNLGVVERKGLVAIRAGDDPRSRLVSLTGEGRAALSYAAPFWAKAQGELAHNLGDDKTGFLELTRRLAAI